MNTELIISKIETVRLAEHPNTIWVQIHTKEGLIGLGETFYLPGAVEAVVHDFAAPMLLGRSALDREQLWQNQFAWANFFGYAGAEMRAISALDIALWDLVGQHLKQPIYNLIGGKCRETIRVYNTCVNTPKYDDQDAFIQRPGELAQSLLSQGIKQMKIWPFDRFAPQMSMGAAVGPAGWSAVGPVGHDLPLTVLKEGLRAVEEIRKTVGDAMEIAIEGHSRWDLNCALRIARALEPYNVIWMEDIIQPDSVDDLARLVNETRVPQCVSERLFTKFAFREVLEKKAAHIVMPDLIWTGGITETLKIATLAEAYHLAIAPHDCTGPVNVFACLHVCAAVPNAMVMESVRGFYQGYYLDIVTDPVPIAEGQATLNFGPGLGTRLRPEVFLRNDISRRSSTQKES
jgi:L-alanine-DL-glutamate epimerase-like enolase superfamily enzyme